LALVVPAAISGPGETGHRGAVRIAKLGPRPAASQADGRDHAVVKRAFRRAGLRVAVQRFQVPAADARAT